MKYEQSVKDIYKIAGMLEILTCMEGRPITEGIAADLADAVDKLELIGADLMNEMQGHEPKIEYHLPASDLIDLLDDDDLETDVSTHEGSEESPPEGQPAYQ